MVSDGMLVNGVLVRWFWNYCDKDRKANQQQIISAANKVGCSGASLPVSKLYWREQVD